MRMLGVEPGSRAREAGMMPLHYMRHVAWPGYRAQGATETQQCHAQRRAEPETARASKLQPRRPRSKQHRKRAAKNPPTRNRTRDHLIAAVFYSQMLYQLSYRRAAVLGYTCRPRNRRADTCPRPRPGPTRSATCFAQRRAQLPMPSGKLASRAQLSEDSGPRRRRKPTSLRHVDLKTHQARVGNSEWWFRSTDLWVMSPTR